MIYTLDAKLEHDDMETNLKRCPCNLESFCAGGVYYMLAIGVLVTESHPSAAGNGNTTGRRTDTLAACLFYHHWNRSAIESSNEEIAWVVSTM